MNEQSLALSLNDSLTEEISSCIGEFAEIGIDSVIDDGLLKDIPFISTVVSMYKIGNSIRERHHIKKMLLFISSINQGTADSETRAKYREKIKTNTKFRNQELEYITILLDRYIDNRKTELLSKLYLAYLDGDIDWIEFTAYGEVIDRLLMDDLDYLMLDSSSLLVFSGHGDSEALRLSALGLLTEIKQTSNYQIRHNNNIPLVLDSIDIRSIKVKEYQITAFGKKLANILR